MNAHLCKRHRAGRPRWRLLPAACVWHNLHINEPGVEVLRCSRSTKKGSSVAWCGALLLLQVGSSKLTAKLEYDGHCDHGRISMSPRECCCSTSVASTAMQAGWAQGVCSSQRKQTALQISCLPVVVGGITSVPHAAR